ncbi:hypothetical protein HPB52_009087 [Rhipicephalus sanguineus]|uniref:Uncharacterized protein n=1 Tax=Rhipicephalus sanguineus TaxID=34632 RepID=A0A9D4PJ39_RHISA|nr:hypothetical protein HPB52_009087 [Rhipicephalus sanguineus]
MLTAYDASKRYNIDLLGAINLLNFTWKELVPSKVVNCFEHAGFSRTIVSDPDDDRTCSDLYEAVDKIARQEVEGDFKTFALADAAAPVVAPATDAEIIDTVGGPDKDEEPREVPTMVQTREHLRLLQNKVECMGGNDGLMPCLVKLEQELLAPGKNLKQPKLTALFLHLNKALLH